MNPLYDTSLDDTFLNDVSRPRLSCRVHRPQPLCCTTQYIYVHLEYLSVCRLVQIGPSHPLSRKRGCPPWTKEGYTRLRVRGWGGPNSDDWRKSLVLCLLCVLSILCRVLTAHLFYHKKWSKMTEIFPFWILTKWGFLQYKTINCRADWHLTYK
jgi:hypothetical protein